MLMKTLESLGECSLVVVLLSDEKGEDSKMFAKIRFDDVKSHSHISPIVAYVDEFCCDMRHCIVLSCSSVENASIQRHTKETVPRLDWKMCNFLSHINAWMLLDWCEYFTHMVEHVDGDKGPWRVLCVGESWV